MSSEDILSYTGQCTIYQHHIAAFNELRNSYKDKLLPFEYELIFQMEKDLNNLIDFVEKIQWEIMDIDDALNGKDIEPNSPTSSRRMNKILDLVYKKY